MVKSNFGKKVGGLSPPTPNPPPPVPTPMIYIASMSIFSLNTFDVLMK